MALVFVDDESLYDIADSIRAKNGSADTYKPGEMSAAIDAIPTGGITPTGTITITANANDIDVSTYAEADVLVPNTYAAGDEGKVVDNGALVSQTSQTYTTNGTYNTTKINSVTVNVSGGGGSVQQTSGSVTIAADGTVLTFPCTFRPDFISVLGELVTGDRHCNGFYFHEGYCAYVRGRNANATSNTNFTVGLGNYTLGTTFGSYYKAEWDEENQQVKLTCRSGYGFRTIANPYTYKAVKYTS